MKTQKVVVRRITTLLLGLNDSLSHSGRATFSPYGVGYVLIVMKIPLPIFDTGSERTYNICNKLRGIFCDPVSDFFFPHLIVMTLSLRHYKLFWDAHNTLSTIRPKLGFYIACLGGQPKTLYWVSLSELEVWRNTIFFVHEQISRKS